MPAFTCGENSDLNQYWFSDNTIGTFVKEIQAQSKLGVAFLSSPSLYFSLTDEALKAKSKVFEYDRQWESDAGFVFYDYKEPEQISIALFGQFDLIVIDPPFITEEVWAKYAQTTRLLLAPGGQVLCTTIVENEGIMKDMMGATPVKFQPSIPNLVYQYNTYTSFHPTKFLDEVNPEIAIEAADPKRRIERDLLDSGKQFMSMAQNRPGREQEPIIPVARVEKSSWDRVPEGLTEYPEGGAPPVPAEPVDYGPEYNAVLARRTAIAEASKLIDSCCKPLDKIWKAKALVEKAADAEKKAEAEANLAGIKKLHGDMLAQLAEYKERFPEREEGTPGDIVCRAHEFFTGAEDISEQDFKKVGPDVQMKYKSPLFQIQKTLLAELKNLKKAAQVKKP
eukprot:TRINITY_DN7814_c0_g1_i1.p1 TRINITY_DN7814_c0_g1~~TRINITY_DN7814_c0_g1_i1.p1  ORF type:complete len:394 (+),score=196.10 TRINITY_DN7814_c0_g1_i1:50-1231(+)